MTTPSLFNLELLHRLPEDMVYLIESYLPIEQIRQYLIYKKYYKKCYMALQPFTIQELNRYFHNDDYFGMNNNKRVSINNYISYNLTHLWSHIPQSINNEVSYEKLKKIIICSRIKSASIKMKKRGFTIR
jgi:hypothetical protein